MNTVSSEKSKAIVFGVNVMVNMFIVNSVSLRCSVGYIYYSS